MKHLSPFVLAAISALSLEAAVREHPAGRIIPHDRYIRTVAETQCPVDRVVVRSKDGADVPVAIRKPHGTGPFPALVYFHGAPGGRGMDKLVSWALGETGSPVLERFLREGWLVAVADYRAVSFAPAEHIISRDRVTYVDDGEAVVNYVRGLGSVDSRRVVLYGVSLGGNVVAHLLGRTDPAAAVLGAPFVGGFLGLRQMRRSDPIQPDPAVLEANIAPVRAPVLVLVGKLDGLLAQDRVFYDEMTRAGKRIDMEVYENGYHDFCMGPQGHSGFNQPLMDSTLHALELTLDWLKSVLPK